METHELAVNGNRTEAIWMQEFQRIAGPDATLSEEAQSELHTLRMQRYGEVDFAATWEHSLDSREILYQRMSTISEHYWSAGWLVNLEYILWEAIYGVSNTTPVSSTSLNELVRLSRLCGGWWVYKHKFVTLSEWSELLRDHKLTLDK